MVQWSGRLIMIAKEHVRSASAVEFSSASLHASCTWACALHWILTAQGRCSGGTVGNRSSGFTRCIVTVCRQIAAVGQMTYCGFPNRACCKMGGKNVISDDCQHHSIVSRNLPTDNYAYYYGCKHTHDAHFAIHLMASSSLKEGRRKWRRGESGGSGGVAACGGMCVAGAEGETSSADVLCAMPC
jgi:hypothetical protein